MTGEWFFSTLAQVVVAVVGFIIAITMVMYSLEKERKRGRTTEYRDILEDFYQSYVYIFDSIQAEISQNSDEIDSYVFDEYDVEDIMEEIFTEDFQRHPSSVQFNCLCLYMTSTIFHDLRPGQLEIPDKKTVESVGKTIWAISDLLQDEESSRSIYRAFSNSEEVSEDFMDESIFDQPAKVNGIEINSLTDVNEVTSEMTSDYIKLRDRFSAVYVDNTDDTYDIINLSLYLIFAGIFLPLLIMFTPPGNLPYEIGTTEIFAFQFIMLGASSILTFSLLDLITAAMKSDVSQTERGEAMCITRKLTKYLPSFI